MHMTTQTDVAGQLSQLEEKAASLAMELARTRESIDSLRNEMQNAGSAPSGGVRIYLQPLRPYDRLRVKWNLGTGLEIPSAAATSHSDLIRTPEKYMRLFGLMADGAPWECRLDFARLARSGGIILGRDAGEADIVIPDEGISRRHVKLELTEQGVEVCDLDSTNGTVLNDCRLSPYHPCATLQNGDTLTMGDVMLQTEIIQTHSSFS